MSRNRALGQATISLLNALAQGARFGLEIMERTGLPSGTVYPTLSRLEHRGYLKGSWEAAKVARREGRPRRRYYELTPEGVDARREALNRLGLLLRTGEGEAVPGPS